MKNEVVRWFFVSTKINTFLELLEGLLLLKMSLDGTYANVPFYALLCSYI